MKDIDEILRIANSNEVEIPSKLEYRIKNTLKNKNQKKLKYKMKKILVTIISILIAFLGSITVYAVSNGKIDGVPIMEYLNVKFSNNYNEYKENVNETKQTYNKTSVELVASLASDYITILEFDIKLSDEDREYLKLDKSLYDEKSAEEVFESLKERAKSELQNNDKEISEAAILERANEMYYKNGIYDDIEEEKKYINSICLGFNKKNDSADFDDMPSTKNYVIIDGEEIWCRNYEGVEKINDNEYKIYHMFLLTEDDLKGKTNFNITLRNNIIANKAKMRDGETSKWKNMYLVNTPNNQRMIKIDGEFSVDVSKDKIMENSKIIDLENKKSNYKNVTQEIEQININPLQTIIKTKTTITGVDSNKSYYFEDEIQNPLWVDFTIKNGDGEELTSQSFETKKILIKSNGNIEQWAPGDIQGSVYKNGTFELTEYIIVEKCDTDKIIITPSFPMQRKSDHSDESHILESIEIDLKE